MKKIKWLLAIMIITLCTGCAKYNINMGVSEDKSVTIEVIFGIDISEYDQEELVDVYYGTDVYDPTDPPTTTEGAALNLSALKYLEDLGYTVEPFTERQEMQLFSGIKATKTFDNIDEITSDEEFELDLFTAFDEDHLSKDTKFFYNKSGKYAAKYLLDFSDEDGEEFYGGKFQNMFDLVYKIKLPTRTRNHNATSVSADGKELTWKLLYGKKNEINFEFSFTNDYLKIFLIGVGSIFGIIILISLISSIRGRRRSLLLDSEITSTPKQVPIMPNVVSNSNSTYVNNKKTETPIIESKMEVAPKVLVNETNNIETFDMASPTIEKKDETVETNLPQAEEEIVKTKLDDVPIIDLSAEDSSTTEVLDEIVADDEVVIPGLMSQGNEQKTFEEVIPEEELLIPELSSQLSDSLQSSNQQNTNDDLISKEN